MKKTLWIIIIILAILVGLIPINYLAYGIEKGYLELKSSEVLNNKIWKFFLYLHIVSGGVAILIGWVQFNQKLLAKRTNWHRAIGKLYIISALLCSFSGVYIGFYATGGWIPAWGFILIACIYFYTTLMAFIYIKNRQIAQHQSMMTYSYAACLAAISLRIYIPLSSFITDDYILAYSFIAWLSWIPNLLIAYWINKNNKAVTFYNSSDNV